MATLEQYHRYLVPPDELQFAEYVFRVNSFNPLPKGQKRKDHKDKWFSISDREALWVIINALANTCGGLIDVRTVSGNPVKSLELDDLQLDLSQHPNSLHKKCLSIRNEDFGSFLVVQKSEIFITAKSYMYTRGLAETLEVFSFNEISAIVSQATGNQNGASIFSQQNFVYEGECTLTEVKEVEFKHFVCKSTKTLMERITNPRCEKVLFAMPNLPNGGDVIIGVEASKTRDQYVFLGIELEEADKLYVLAKLSKFMQVSFDGVPRVWGKLSHTDVKEGKHWFCNFISLKNPPHICGGATCICPSKGERYLIHLHFPHCPGGVFLRKPQAFVVTEKGHVNEVALYDWFQIHQGKFDTVPLQQVTPEASVHAHDSTSDLAIKQNEHMLQGSLTAVSSSASLFSNASDLMSAGGTCEDNVTIKFSAHSTHKKHLVAGYTQMPMVLHPEKFDMFKMSHPIHYTPAREQIESVLSDKFLLETIEESVKDTKAFGVASDSLFSCIKHSVSGQRPPHHLMDVMVVTQQVSILLFVICSMFGSSDENKLQKTYTMTLGQVLKRQITKESNCRNFIIQCRILYLCGACFESKLFPFEWMMCSSPNCQRDVCEGLMNVFIQIQTHFSDALLKSASFEFSREQLLILENVRKNRFNFIEGPPGSGKTLLAQSICEEHGKDKSVYISNSTQLRNYVRHKGLVHAVWAATESDLLKTIYFLPDHVHHIVIDDAHNMRFDIDILKRTLDYCQETKRALYVFQDSIYQNFDHKVTQVSFVDAYFKHRLDCMYDSALYDTIKVIRRNSVMVGSYITALIPDITPTNPVHFESQLRGDDVIVKHIKDLRAKENNGLVVHVQGILSKENFDPQNRRYTKKDVAVLFDNTDPDVLKAELEWFRQIFNSAWPESSVQTAEKFPVQGIVIDTLENFSGLEARVVVFVRPNIPSTDPNRSILNPKYRIAIATRGIDRVDFVQGAKLGVAKLNSLKFDNISSDLFKPELQCVWTQSTRSDITDLAVDPSGEVILCHGWTKKPHRSLSCLSSDGQPRSKVVAFPGFRPWSLSVHPSTGYMVMMCVDRENESRHSLVYYKGTLATSLSRPTLREVKGQWGEYVPRVVWANEQVVAAALQDTNRIWWLVTCDVTSHREIRKVRTACEWITDISVGPNKGGSVYVCDYSNDNIHVFSLSGTPSHTFSLTSPDPESVLSDPYSLCAIGAGGERVVVCHKNKHGGQWSVSVSLWSRQGGHIKDLVTGLALAGTMRYRVRVSEDRGDVFVSDGHKTLWKYNMGEWLGA